MRILCIVARSRLLVCVLDSLTVHCLQQRVGVSDYFMVTLDFPIDARQQYYCPCQMV